MHFHPPATIPTINYAYAAPYASLPKPHPQTILYDRVYNDDHIGVKCHLRNLLKKNKLSCMPIGFPFHCVHDRVSGQPVLSHTSYEFKEYFCFSDQRARMQHATFTYFAPEPYSRHGTRMMSWRIYLPARESSSNRDAPKRVSIAHVQVDSLVMETSFGLDLMTNPRILLEALALSIELGILVTVQVANHKTPMMYPSKRNVYYDCGEIIFLSTDDHGRSEVAFVFEP